MPVAVRLVEVLALITLLGMLTGLSIVIVVAQRAILLTFLCLEPATDVAIIILSLSEKVLCGALLCTLNMVNTVSNAMHG